jgi:hypothetical protein
MPIATTASLTQLSSVVSALGQNLSQYGMVWDLSRAVSSLRASASPLGPTPNREEYREWKVANFSRIEGPYFCGDKGDRYGTAHTTSHEEVQVSAYKSCKRKKAQSE